MIGSLCPRFLKVGSLTLDGSGLPVLTRKMKAYQKANKERSLLELTRSGSAISFQRMRYILSAKYVPHKWLRYICIARFYAGRDSVAGCAPVSV